MDWDDERIEYLDGLRGMAIFLIVLGHLVIALFPSMITQNPPDVHTPFDMILGFAPLGFLWNADFGVCLFAILSGYALSRFCVRSQISFPAKLLRRYLRLALPILLTSTLAWLLLALQVYENSPASEFTRSGWLGGWYHFSPNFPEMLQEAFWGAFVHGANTYNFNLATMSLALFGSIYIFILYALFKSRRDRLVVLLIFAAVHAGDYYVLFAAGALFYDQSARLRVILPPSRVWLAGCLAVLGVIFGSVPFVQHVEAQNLRGMDLSAFLPIYQNANIFHQIGAVMLFIGLLSSVRLQQWFSRPAFRYFGRLSFIIYLIDIPLLCTVTSWVIVYFPYDTPYLNRAAAAAAVTIIAALAIAAILNGLVEVRATRFSRFAGDWLDRRFGGCAAPSNEPSSSEEAERDNRAEMIT